MPDVLSVPGGALASPSHDERDRVSIRVGSIAHERGQAIQEDQERRVPDARGDEATRAALASLEVGASVRHRAATGEEGSKGCVEMPEDAPEQFTQDLQLPHHGGSIGLSVRSSG